MPCQSLTHLKAPPRRYRLSETVVNFETESDSQYEDRLRAKLLAATQHSGDFGIAANALAKRLSESRPGALVASPASSLYMRDMRNRVIGNLHKLIDDTAPEQISTFTAVKQSWAWHAGDLFEASAPKIIASFRADLNRCGAKFADGWLFGALDCEYSPPQQCYQFHIHGVATNGMIAVLDKLRSRRGFSPWQGVLGIPDGPRPLVISRAVLTNLPRPFAYGLKSFYQVKTGKRISRLPGDEHTRALLFVNRYRIEELTLRVKLRVVKGVFR